MANSRTALIILTSVLFSLGLVMIFNTNSAEIMDLSLERSPHIAMFKQMAYAGLGLGCAHFIMKIGVRRFVRYSPLFLGLLTLALALCFVPGLGKAVNGSRRWVAIGGLSFQPSEFVKYVIPAFFILRMSTPEKRSKAYHAATFILIALPIFLIFIEPNNGTVGVILAAVVALCFLMEIPMKTWALPLLIIAALAGGCALQLPYVRSRIAVYLNPDLDIRGKGHQPLQAKIAAGSGRFLGKGPGRSLQKLSYLPEAQNDYIAAIYAEEFGFCGMSLLIFLYLAIIYFGMVQSFRAIHKEEALMAGAAMFLIAFQAFMNLGVVSGLLPSTGLNLPFFSQGGTSLIANIMGLSLILNVKTENRYEAKNCHQRRRVRRPSFPRASFS